MESGNRGATKTNDIASNPVNARNPRDADVAELKSVTEPEPT
jgi:hypothetical protein